MSEFASEPLSARALVAVWGYRVWRHNGSDGVNVHNQARMEQLAALGCRTRPYQPESFEPHPAGLGVCLARGGER